MTLTRFIKSEDDKISAAQDLTRRIKEESAGKSAETKKPSKKRKAADADDEEGDASDASDSEDETPLHKRWAVKQAKDPQNWLKSGSTEAVDFIAPLVHACEDDVKRLSLSENPFVRKDAVEFIGEFLHMGIVNPADYVAVLIALTTDRFTAKETAVQQLIRLSEKKHQLIEQYVFRLCGECVENDINCVLVSCRRAIDGIRLSFWFQWMVFRSKDAEGKERWDVDFLHQRPKPYNGLRDKVQLDYLSRVYGMLKKAKATRRQFCTSLCSVLDPGMFDFFEKKSNAGKSRSNSNGLPHRTSLGAANGHSTPAHKITIPSNLNAIPASTEPYL